MVRVHPRLPRRLPKRPLPASRLGAALDLAAAEAETEDLAVILDGLHESVATAPTGSQLVDGLRAGLAARGLTVAEIFQSAVLPTHVLEPILAWRPGRVMSDAIAWAHIIEAIAGQCALRVVCLPQRRSTVGLEVVLRSLLERSGSAWEPLIRRVAAPMPAGHAFATWDLRDAGHPCLALDHVAYLAGVAPVLVPGAPSSAN